MEQLCPGHRGTEALPWWAEEPAGGAVRGGYGGCGVGGHAVMCAEVPVRAVLYRVTVPLADISDWAVDQLLELPSGSLTSVELEGMDGRVAATVKLGQVGGMRAVRIGAPGSLAKRRTTSQLARISDGERFTAKPGGQ